MIGGNNRRFATVVPWTASIAGLGPQPFATHEAGDSMLTAANAFFAQILMDLAVPIHPAAFQPRVFYPAEKTLVFLSTLRQLVLAPGVITTWKIGRASCRERG